MPSKAPISVLIPVKNEEQNIRACLESVKWADEIFVVDSHSEDKTVEIAQEYTDKIIQFHYVPGGPKKKNWSLENLPFAHEWVLIIDADERITPELRDEICDVIQRDETDGYYINRRFIFLGEWIKHCGWYPSWNLRLFKHLLGRYELLGTDEQASIGDNEVHEHVILKGGSVISNMI
jgi:glycosyltransferase involved in cell wall biosynthesis